MTLYTPRTPELGKNATAPRVNALRAMNNAGGAQYKRYVRGGTNGPSYHIHTTGGELRELATREVPAYVVGQADAYDGLLIQVQEALGDALAHPEVTDRETLMAMVAQGLEDRCGKHLREAADYFVPADHDDDTADAPADHDAAVA